MSPLRVLALAPLLAAGASAAAQGCALVTCIEDGCATADDTTATTGSGGAGGGGASSVTVASAGGAGGDGVGGAGGGGTCTKDCVGGPCELEPCQPVCSPLGGSGQAVAFGEPSRVVYAIQAGADRDLVAIDEDDLGVESPNVQAPMVEADVLATAGDVVFYANTDGVLGPPCMGAIVAGSKLRGGASLPTQTLWMSSTDIEIRSENCGVDATHHLMAFDAQTLGARSVSGSVHLAYAGKASPTDGSQQLCMVTASGFDSPECFDVLITTGGSAVSATAVVPSGEAVLFATEMAVLQVPWGSKTPVVLVPDLPTVSHLAATNDAFFVARSGSSVQGSLLRCPGGGQPEDCRSYGDAPVGGITQTADRVYFTMGNKLCAWD